MIDASVNPRILHPPHPATPAGVVRIWRVECRGWGGETARAPTMETLTQQLVPSVGAGQKEGALDQERKLAAVVGVEV